MITPQELSALTQLLNRLPMTQAEGLWVQHFMDKLGAASQSATGATIQPLPKSKVKTEDKDDS